MIKAGRTHAFHILPLVLIFTTSTSGHPTTARFVFNHPTRSMENSRTRRFRTSHQSAAVDCFFFVYFGTCGFGDYCMFNHPNPIPVHHSADQEAIRENMPARYARVPCKV
ncbi:putative transcription factor C3H family [Helianthus debilis subsp. tardiflorus]